MAVSITSRDTIENGEQINAVTGLLREWFGLPAGSAIHEDFHVDFVEDGGILRIELMKHVSAEQLSELRAAYAGE